MANDGYEIRVQALVDTSGAAQSKFNASLQSMSKAAKVEIEDISVAPSSLEKLGLQLAGVTKKSLKIHFDADSSAVWNVRSKLQDIARQQGVTLNFDINAQDIISRLNQAIAQSRTGISPVEIPTTFRIQTQKMAQEAASAAAKIAANPGAPWSDSFFKSADFSQRARESVKQNTEAVKEHAEAEKEDAEQTDKNATATTGMIGKLAAYAFSIQHVIRFMREMVNITIELNSAMTQLKIVTQATDEQYAQYANNIARTAKEIGIATKDLIDASTVYARLGYKLTDASTLAKYTGMLQNVGDIEASTAQSAITSIVKAYDIDIAGIEDVMDKLVVVGNNFPISVSQIAEGMMNASSSLHAAGNNLDESIALLTAANTTTQNISKASTAVRTISARLRNTKAELDELGEEVMTTAKYQGLVDMMTRQGVSLVDEQTGDLRSTYAVLKDIAAVWNDISVNERAALATEIAGVRQQNVFYSILEQFQEAEKAMDAMTGSAGTLDKAYSIYMESITAHINQFKAAWQALSQTVMDSGLITKIVDIGASLVKLVDGLIKIAKELKIFGPLIATIPLVSILTHLEGIGKFLGGASLVKGIGNLALLIKNFRQLGPAIKGVETALTALGGAAGIASGVLTALGLLATAIIAIKAARDNLNVTIEDRAEQISETQAEVESLEKELASVRDRIAEIQSMGPLSLTDASELSKLEAENAELEGRLAVQKALLESQKEAARYQALGQVSSATSGASNSITQYQNARNAIIEARKPQTGTSIAAAATTYAQADLQRLQQYRAEWDSYTQRQKDNTGYKSLEALDAKIKEIQESISQFSNAAANGALTAAGDALASQTSNIASEIARIATLISVLDADQDAEQITQLRIALAQLYDTIGAGQSVAATFGAMLDNDTASQISEIVKAIEGGKDSGARIRELWGSEGVQGVVEALAAAGVNIDIGIFIRYISSLIQIKEAANNAGGANEKLKKSFSEVASNIQKLTPGLKQLSTIYADIADGGSFDFGSMLNNSTFTEAFSGLGEAYENFIQVVSDSPDDLAACQEAFNYLTEEYIRQSGVLEELSEETRDVAIAMLEEAGVANAADAIDRLIYLQADLARQTEATEGMTWREISALYAEAEAGSTTAGALAQLAYQQALANNTTVNTAADVQNIYDLAAASYAGAEAREYLTIAKQKFAAAETAAAYGVAAAQSGDFESSQMYSRIADAARDLGRQYMTRAKNVTAPTIDFRLPGGGNAAGNFTDHRSLLL